MTRSKHLAGSAALALMGAVGVAATAAAAPPTEFPTDDRGFVGTAAYCQGAAVATAFGRTRDALVAICSGPDGQLQYRGVRLDDDAALMLTAAAAPDGFTAENDGVVYRVSATELIVTSGDTTVHRQPMIEYRRP
ncbi:hypothetical protein [Mycolicibacterium litorale]|uniref:hypothetical protein n=1 Tax=Mycolicibacterium litorale TaxID=758802 RepID=UPI0016265D59|nr:hypothetical protein [Mycolicibacterium litorale]